MRRRRWTLTPKRLGVSAAAAVAILAGFMPYALHAWPGLENTTLDARFSVRGPQPAPRDVAIVAIDDRTFDALGIQWPFRRRLHAKVISILRADGAKVIAYDVQFTEPSAYPTDDWDLYSAVATARDVVLATTEVDSSGKTNVLGGEQNLRPAHAVAAAANLPQPGRGVVRRYSYSMLGLPSFATATAHAAGSSIGRSAFDGGSALIDFRGPPGTITTYSFSDVLSRRVSPLAFAGKVVVVGATAATLQDLHQTATTSQTPMAGVEVQANAIWTALHGNPLRPAPGWLAALAILLCALVAPLASLRLRVLSSALIALAFVAGYLVLAQAAFDAGTVITVAYPLIAATTGIVSTLAASYVAALAERNAFSTQLHESQRELLQRLAQAVESRDTETGEHTLRIGVMCRRLALALGWSANDARTLMYASIAHDIGKIGIPDVILRKSGALDAAEWELMKTHTTIGAELLAGSTNPLMQMAESVARAHHEHWDGSGYPGGLAGEAIPIGGRICAVVDVYDALISKRPYKDIWTKDEALAEIERGAGTHFDPQIAAVFLRLAPQLDAELHASIAREWSAHERASARERASGRLWPKAA